MKERVIFDLNSIIEMGATLQEAEKVLELYNMLSPCLIVNKNNRFNISNPMKSVNLLGLYRKLYKFYIKEV